MRGVVAGAAYRPEGSGAAWDEDAFTLAASAAEALQEARPDLPRPDSVVVAGAFGASELEDLTRFLGLPAGTVVPREPTLASAVAHAGSVTGTGGLTLVIGVQLRAGGQEGDAALALAIGEGASVSVPTGPPPETLGAEISGWSAGIAGARILSGSSSTTPSVAGASTPDPPLVPGQPVAQGAYVPWARYLEATRAHWSLVAERCPACGTVTFPAGRVCRGCGARDGLMPLCLGRDSGVIAALTTIGPGGQPTEFDPQVDAHGPYGVAIVEFPEGVRATLQVADHAGSPLALGSPVATRLRRTYPMEGRWRYARKVLPRAPGPNSG